MNATKPLPPHEELADVVGLVLRQLASAEKPDTQEIVATLSHVVDLPASFATDLEKAIVAVRGRIAIFDTIEGYHEVMDVARNAVAFYGDAAAPNYAASRRAHKGFHAIHEAIEKVK